MRAVIYIVLTNAIDGPHTHKQLPIGLYLTTKICENRSYLHIKFYDYEDTQLLNLWVSCRYRNLTQKRLSIGLYMM